MKPQTDYPAHETASQPGSSLNQLFEFSNLISPRQAMVAVGSSRRESNPSPVARKSTGDEQISSGNEPQGWKAWFTRDTIAFFIQGSLVALPCMIVTTGANDMFSGLPGIYGVAMSLAAALTSFVFPLILHHIPHSVRVLMVLSASTLCFLTCSMGRSIAGPTMGTVLSGFVYAFGCNFYLAVTAFYDSRTVVSFISGAGFSGIIGTSLYIGLVQAFSGEWRKALLVCIPLPSILPVIWCFVLSEKGRQDAEQCRLKTKRKTALDSETSEAPPLELARFESVSAHGFGPGKSRLGLFGKVLLPRYVMPLFLCTTGAMFTLSGLCATFDSLHTFKKSPGSELGYQINFLAYGTAQFLSATLTSIRPIPHIYLLAALQLFVVGIGISQLFKPFLTYYGVWLIFMFITGGVVGGSTSNTNWKVAKEFKERGEPEAVRSFAMSYGGMGNFSGDTVGGVLAVVLNIMIRRKLVAGA